MATYCDVLSTADGCRPSDFLSTHHVHILVGAGSMTFSDGRHSHVSRPGDLVIWQMSNSIQQVGYSGDFEADFLIVASDFLQQFNPEMTWASKGFVFIRLHPSFHLHEASLGLLTADFALLRDRLGRPESAFKREVLGRVLQIFLYDLWTVYSSEMAQMEAGDNASRIFLRFLAAVQRDCSCQRDVAHYAGLLCITPKYLSQVSRQVTGLPASQWIAFYAAYELIALLNDRDKPLTLVADLMNFGTTSHFSRWAKNLLGKSPSQYRQNG